MSSGYVSIRIVCDTAGTSVKDFRMQGKFINALSVGDVFKTSGYEQDEEHSEIINFTDTTTVSIGTIVVVFFET